MKPTPKLNAALAKFHEALEGNIEKNKKGFNYDYADLTSTLNFIRKPLAENGLTITQAPVTYRDVEPPLPVLQTTLLHTSGEYIQSEFPLDMNWRSLTKGNVLQNIGSMLTYVKRYSLQSILSLGVEKYDDDGKSAEYNKPNNKKKWVLNIPGREPQYLNSAEDWGHQYEALVLKLMSSKQLKKDELNHKLKDLFSSNLEAWTTIENNHENVYHKLKNLEKIE